MAVFKAFKPEAMNKIAKAMGYTGDMGQFQSFIEQDPMRQQQMQRYTNAAIQMAKGGVVKMQQGGTPIAANFNVNPGTYEMRQRGVDPFRIEPDDFTGIVGPGGLGTYAPAPQPVTKPAANTGSVAPVQGLTPAVNVGGLEAAVTPQTFNYTYEQAVTANANRAVKSPAEQAAIDAAIARGPSMQVQQQIYPQAAVPAQQFQDVQKPVLDEEGKPTGATETVAPTIGDVSAQMMQTPGLPTGGTTMAAQIQETAGQMVDPRTGLVTGTVGVPTAVAGTAGAIAAQEKAISTTEAAQAAPAVDAAMQATQAAQGTLDPKAQVTAAQQTASSVGNVNAAQGNAILLENPVQRQIQAGELVSGVADAETAAQFTEQIQAAEATPSKQATVQGQLEGLMQQFEGGETPAWAAGAMRAATQAMAARGLGASSIAGQAVVQAAMESALPIAQADAGVIASFEQMNLSNRQQRAMLAAEQRASFIGLEFDQAFQARVQNASRIADVANQNFTADQQIALENSRAANTINLNNLSNRQALVMSEAAALANMDAANLNNRQQAAVQNAQNFLQVDMTNLSNQQQTELFRAQQRVQSLFTDQAAENASRQFNATSQNQVDQFFANLNTQVSQYNASQINAQNQFNAGQRNSIERFNAEINNQRDQFNATNQLAIAQNNAQWRRQIATANTSAVNRANEINAEAVLDISRDAYDNLWNYYADTMEWAWKSAESQLERYNDIAIEQLRADKAIERTNIEAGSAAGSAIGNMVSTLGYAAIMKFCWVAREVYGPANPDWLRFREWMFTKAPDWFFNMYGKYGEAFAGFISNKPKIKFAIKWMMDKAIKHGN